MDPKYPLPFPLDLFHLSVPNNLWKLYRGIHRKFHFSKGTLPICADSTKDEKKKTTYCRTKTLNRKEAQILSENQSEKKGYFTMAAKSRYV